MQGSTLVVRVTENPILNRVVFEGNRAVGVDYLKGERLYLASTHPAVEPGQACSVRASGCARRSST